MVRILIDFFQASRVNILFSNVRFLQSIQPLNSLTWLKRASVSPDPRITLYAYVLISQRLT
jgi:hypothetical protein